MSLDRVIAALEDADKIATAALSTVDRVLGFFGRRGARWHRWWAFRLRLRATRIEAGKRRRRLSPAERAAEVARLRQEASSHMLQAHRLVHDLADDAPIEPLPRESDLEAMRALSQGREPLASRRPV